MKVVIVSENISMKMGGEASLGLYYFKLFRNSGVATYAVCHARVREELREAFTDEELQQCHFIEDSWLQAIIWRIGRLFPQRISDFVFGQLIHVLTMLRVRKVVLRLCADRNDWVCFEPSPISPLGLSFMFGLGIPVVIGPLCGGLEFPPAFRYMDGMLTRATIRISRQLAKLANRVVPGKLEADALIVANECTRRALPPGCLGKIYEVVESGVDLAIWTSRNERSLDRNAPVRFVFSGRFEELKGITFLVEAFRSVAEKSAATLEIIGDGKIRGQIEAKIRDLGMSHRVHLHGWRSRPDAAAILRDCDVFVMPSLRECGGTAILEAMAIGLPVIATNWAGPANYVTSASGILVDPLSRKEFINGLSDAMLRLAIEPDTRIAMGRAAVDRARSNFFDWDSKANRVLEILRHTLRERPVETAVSKA